jgi:lipid II:glycine glycyltransferase (peptidoglycan interpeptide bridge formation enzyme)
MSSPAAVIDRAPEARALRLTWSSELAGGDAADYDAFVERAPAGHFAQARAWTTLACAGRPFSSAFVLVRDRDGALVGAAHLLRLRVAGLPLPYAVVERGPVVADPALFGPVLAEVARAARRRGVLRLMVMPYWEADTDAGATIAGALADGGWRRAQAIGGSHTTTLRFACAGKPDEALFGGGDRLKLRQKIRQAERDGARVRRGSAADVPLFADLYRALMTEQGMHVKPASWFRALGDCRFEPDGPAALFFTEHDGEPVSGALVIRHGRLVTLYMSASARAPRKFSKMVPSVVAAIRWARDLHCDFDLGGIPMEGDSDPKRLAIAQFKRDFVKTPVQLLAQHGRLLLSL